MFGLLAQEVVRTQPSDPVGWILQGGAVGILGLLAWWVMYKGLPEMRQDRKELVEAFKTEMASERATFKEEVETVRTRADARTDRIAARIETAMNKMSDAVDRNTDATREQASAMSENTVTLKKGNGSHHD